MKAKKIFILFGVVLLLSSCAIPKYTHVYTSSKYLDLRYGSWLVNYASGNTPEYLKKNIEDKVIQKFHEMGVDSIVSLRDIVLDYISPALITSNLTPETLQLFRNTTGFSYILSIETFKVKDELSGLVLSAPEEESHSISEVILKVYDLKEAQWIYHHRVMGKVTMDEDYTDYTFAKSANGLVYGAVKQALKKIQKYALVKE